MSFQIQLKQKVSEAELDEVVDLTLRAFGNDLSIQSMVGDDDSLKGPVFRAMIRAGELDGEVYLATEIGSMKAVGVAVWFPPGKSLFATEEQRALGFDEFFEKLSPEIKNFWNDTYDPVVDKFLAETIGPTACYPWTADYWYLNLIATDPAFQNKGIATMLLKTLSDSDSRPMLAHCASNEPNVRFYESCDYHVKGKIYMEAATGGYPVFCLTK
ncbi:hypothetical protein B0H10DRAFT_2207371 [Mycena sp. CBHHK59/15]|nr:hypothetical protein B0H10DRAFT_2207371 [Mycena sp. CBHHK59/15]